MLFGVSIRLKFSLFDFFFSPNGADSFLGENRTGATAQQQQDVRTRTLIIIIAVHINCALMPICSDVKVSQDRVIKVKHRKYYYPEHEGCYKFTVALVRVVIIEKVGTKP